MRITFKETKIGRIPEEWDVKKFSSLAQYINGRAFNPQEWGKTGLPIIRILQLNNPNAGCDYYDGEVDERNIIDNGDLVFSWSATLAVIIWNRGKAALNQHLFKVIPSDDMDKRFLRHRIDSSIEHLARMSHGSTMKHIKKGVLDEVSVAVPPLPEQRKIAEILSTVDESIEKTDAIIEQTQQLKKGLMQKLFTEGIGHTRFKETKIGRIPEEWDIVGLSDVFQVIDGDRGVNYPKSHEMHADGYCVFLNAKNVTKSGFQFNEIQFVTKEKDEILSKGKLIRGDLVLTTRGTLGNFAYFNDGVPFENLRVNSGMVVLRPLNNIIADFYYKYFNTYSMQNQIERLAFGTAQSQLTVSGIKKLKLLVPSNDEQRKIAEILSEMDAKIETEETFKSELHQLKKGLMQVLLTGKVRVKV